MQTAQQEKAVKEVHNDFQFVTYAEKDFNIYSVLVISMRGIFFWEEIFLKVQRGSLYRSVISEEMVFQALFVSTDFSLVCPTIVACDTTNKDLSAVFRKWFLSTEEY